MIKDWYLAYGWLLVLITAAIFISYYYVHNVHECTAQPLDYAVKQIHEKYDVDVVTGRVNIYKAPTSYDFLDFGDVDSDNNKIIDFKLKE